jgi:hypothetical protein
LGKWSDHPTPPRYETIKILHQQMKISNGGPACASQKNHTSTTSQLEIEFIFHHGNKQKKPNQTHSLKQNGLSNMNKRKKSEQILAGTCDSGKANACTKLRTNVDLNTEIRDRRDSNGDISGLLDGPYIY